MALQPGDLLNQRYSIEKVIAIGGMGSVYRALDTVLNIQVAVKENTQTAEQFIRQFRREAALLSRLNHPNLPRVTDHFAIADLGQYLVMDYIEGQDLRERLAKDSILAESEVIGIGIAVCGALAYLHSRQPTVVHRDIKPGNIKISPSGQVFLVDFGLAKMSNSGQNTTTGAQALTPGFAPPEQYGQGTEPRSDIYALGATLYAALTGKVPQDALERAMGNTVLTPIRQWIPSVSTRTARAVEKALNIRPEDRYQTAGDFSSALAPITPPNLSPNPELVPPANSPGAQPIMARPAIPSNPPPVGSPQPLSISQSNRAPGPALLPAQAAPTKPSSRLLVWILAPILILILGSGLFLLRNTFKNRSAKRLPTLAALLPATQKPSSTPGLSTMTQQAAFVPTKGVTVQPSPSREMPPTLTPSFTPTVFSTPLGGGAGEIAFSSNRSGTTQLWLTGSNGKALTQITNLPDGACQPDWSPDGKRLVFVSPCPGRLDSYPGSSLFIINANGTGLIPLASLPGGDYDPAWSPDGQTIAFTSVRNGRDGIYLYHLADNTVKRISSPVNLERRPAWSPDGQTIAYETRRQGKPQIWVMAIDGSKMREFSKLDSGFSMMPAWAPQIGGSPDAGLLIYSQGNEMPLLVGRKYGDPTTAEIQISDKITGGLEARYAPDGFWLAFTQIEPQGATSVYRIMSSGGDLTKIPGSLGGDFHPAWRP